MRTVFVIKQGSYSDYHVVGVFSTKEKAQLVFDALKNGDDYDKPEMVEWPIDPAVDELSAGLKPFYVQMNFDGSTERLEPRNLSSYELGMAVTIWERTKALAYAYAPDIRDILTATVFAKDEQHAVKIVNEHRTRLIAEGKFKP